MSSPVFSPLTLASSVTVKNRLVKAAMEENMATDNQLPSTELMRLYHTWAQGGVGLIITGNVMVDHMAMTGPGGVALEAETDLTSFRSWASAAKHNNTKVVMQINHPGRQVFKNMGGKVLSPSDVALDMGKHSHMFAKPTPMTEAEIQDVITRFAVTAQKAQDAGFDGIEIHAAHGYLLSQFLSPLTNKRNDNWGGSIENRARLLIEIVKLIKSNVSDHFIVSVKLNSADFMRGGFDVADAKKVVELLGGFNLDFIEISGGSYEAPAMQGRTADERTLAREAYFLEFAQEIANSATMPIMVTGGIKRLAIAEQALEKQVQLVGMATALAMTPDLPNQWQKQPNLVGNIPTVNWKDKTLSGLATMAVVKQQLKRIGNGKPATTSPSPVCCLVKDQFNKAKLTKRYRKQYQQELIKAN
ncbi:NADH:flavin oxidoreductase/NADH oxidase family protein [Thalassotalea sp. M1531]|uniref:NADH:flavin oxidoreductase/NADH oxidase family protein n=1 Tax=Thalassotalea algicola TaxID=2716224 RepID=A0A7Y0LA93_9GAMM|nr:NADH:flavin oxidoreductase/NADH oxidase family protein [Thalassotalea algicola]NMP30849.1 NADH:flavin oxidoreductase/NADH oxidase family protein [Thalassotalea algicola]